MNRRMKKMGIVTAVIIVIASAVMWGDMLRDIISLHISDLKTRKRRKVLYEDESAE